VYTQPLIVPGVTLTAGGTHDVAYVATMSDTVYAFDANDTAASAPLWSTSLLPPGAVPVANTDMTGACGGNYQDISGNIGVVGTPVIDPSTHLMYLVARTKENAGTTFVQRLHAIDIRDGSEQLGGPVAITAQVSGTGDGSTTVTFDPLRNNQRASLLLDNGVVYVAFASHCDWGPYHGWILGYDASTLNQVAVFNPTPDGGAGGIWMAGQGPAADGQGSIYVVTGNGTVGVGGDPTSPRNRGESFLRLAESPSGLTTASWFTPHEYPRLNAGDLDLGSAGPMLVPNTNLVIGGGKNSKLYAMDRNAMGGGSVGTKHDDPPAVQVVPLEAQHLHGSPVYWNGPNAALVYTWDEFDHLKSFRFDPGDGKFDPRPLAVSPNPAPDGMPGGFLSISASGGIDGTGILWAYLPESGDGNQAVVPGALHAFDATNVGVELWNSSQNPNDRPGSFGKFASPTIADGRVYLATFSNAVCTYGLLPGVQPLAAPNGLSVTATSKTSAALQWMSQSTTETGFEIERKQGFLGFEPIAMAPAGATTFVDTTVSPFGAYSYRVRALGQPAPSAYSNAACVVTNVGSPAPRVDVTGAGHSIPSGTTSVTWTADTDFGGVDLTTTATRTFTVTNVGNAPLTWSAPISVAGPGAGYFSITAQPAASIAPGASTTFGVTFAPTALGVQVATLQLSTNDPDQPAYTFAVSGVPTGDQLGWWKLDEAAGTAAADAAGEQGPAVATNVTWVAGHTGGAASFDGSTSSIVLAENVSLDPYALTIAAWINPVDWMGNRRIAQKGAFDDQYRLLSEGGVLKFDIAGVGTVTSTLPPTGTWTHVAVTYDGATMQLYVDGAPVASQAATGTIPDSPDPLCIGAKPPNPSPLMNTVAAGDHFNGLIDEVHLYGRALSTTEIQLLAQ
jgi:hypothetical protein